MEEENKSVIESIIKDKDIIVEEKNAIMELSKQLKKLNKYLEQEEKNVEEKLKKIVTRWGNSCHIPLPRRYDNHEAIIKILKLKEGKK